MKITKQSAEKIKVTFDFSGKFASTETISGSPVLSVVVLRGTDPDYASMLSGSPTVSGAVVTQLIRAGVAGASYFLAAQVTTSTGQILIEKMVLSVESGDEKSALFIRAIDVEILRSGSLDLASATYAHLSALSDDTIWLKMVAAEAEVQRKLGVYLSPIEIFPSEPTPDELTALNGARYLVEPGYDLPPDFFAQGQFGFFTLRERPVISIAEIKLKYPNQGGASFTIPQEWIRLDNKYGQVSLFPSAISVTAPLSIFVMQAMGSGFNVPHMIRVRYTAGLSNTSEFFPDVVDLVRRVAVLRLLHDSVLPQSGSISGDGLSESISTDMDKLQGATDDMINTLKMQLVGPVFGVM
jgi:hypothetical protein